MGEDLEQKVTDKVPIGLLREPFMQKSWDRRKKTMDHYHKSGTIPYAMLYGCTANFVQSDISSFNVLLFSVAGALHAAVTPYIAYSNSIKRSVTMDSVLEKYKEQKDDFLIDIKKEEENHEEAVGAFQEKMWKKGMAYFGAGVVFGYALMHLFRPNIMQYLITNSK